jgi:phospholipid transport system transporter-binding protein
MPASTEAITHLRLPSALEQFDSSVLAVLLDCRRRVVAMGWRFTVAHLPERLRQLAGLYGVAELLPAS